MKTFNFNNSNLSRGSRWLAALLLGGLGWCAAPAFAAIEDPGYRLNAGDKLEITVWEEEKLKQEVVVLPDGTISFPLVGRVQAAGKTTEKLAEILRAHLREFIADAEINVSLLAAEGNKIYVTGEVTHPGAFVMTRPTNVMQAISMAGGLTEFAKKNDIRVLRLESDGKNQALPFEYGDVEDGENIDTNILLQSGDTLVVP